MSDPEPDRLGPDADDLYATLLAAHADLSPDESAALNARLVLILLNALGDPARSRAAIAAARAAAQPSE